jgi:alpha-1,3-glucosyltransferase
MGDLAADFDGRGIVQVGRWSVGLFWYVESGRLLEPNELPCVFGDGKGNADDYVAGYQNPPMYGDYEAQRHWMEVTTQLPISQWYFHDLEWWGLDYPPLTAYHSWVLGKIGGSINPKWFALHTSRGLEDDTLKIFMRATVIVSEYLIYIPAAVIFVRRFSRSYGVHTWDASVALLAILMQPSTILIDHVHFQYNTVMLGLVLASMSSMLAGRLLWGSVFFVLALGFKQMALYYAPAIFAYLLGVSLIPKIRFFRLLSIAVITLISFSALMAPLLLGALWEFVHGVDARPDLFGYAAPLPFIGSYSLKLDTKAWYYPLLQQTTQLLFRVFPFSRGLFEDKVANFWCALNVAIKLKTYDAALLQRASLLATLAAIFPPCVVIFVKPKKELLPLALASTAWAFFMFSFQVHEKSVLLPLMPMTLLIAGKGGLSKYTRAWVGFANILAVWTLFPLLRRVDLSIPYYVLSGLWAYLVGLPPTTWAVYEGMSSTWIGLGTSLMHTGFYVAMAAWHVAEAWLTPPSTLPDLWVVINVGIGATGFAICYLWCVGTLVIESGLLAGGKADIKTKEKEKKTQ